LIPSPSALTWLRRLGAPLLCAALLLAQQQWHLHPLSHLHEVAAAQQELAHAPASEPQDELCGLCLACAATASLAPAAAAAALPAMPPAQLVAAALATSAWLGANTALHFIRGPPPPTVQPG
jgi:cobalamin biosynthesis protein CobD/CbiB